MKKYDARSIQVLKGLEGVRKRPAMYIGDTSERGMHHLINEVVDNAVDEAMAGFCNEINVSIVDDRTACIRDNGRGIPVGIHPEFGIPAVEVVLTTLHAGAKFENKIYRISGGLHGVGISVVNALSERFEVEIAREGKLFRQTYERGEPTSKLEVIGIADYTGTKITFSPDSEIFKKELSFKPDIVRIRLQEIAFLNPQLRIVFTEKEHKKHIFYYPKGMLDFLNYVNTGKKALHKPIVFTEEKKNVKIELSMVYNDDYRENILTFVNTINTHEGGSHLSGFKAALTRVINDIVKRETKVKFNITGEDTREGLTAILSVRIPNPQFEGQTKTKLGNSEIKGIVESTINEYLSTYFSEHPKEANIVIEKVISAAKSRLAARKAKELERSRSLLTADNLPGKLADCSSNNIDENELFIVEGESAGGSAKQGRDRRFQAVLSLRGKILNIEKAKLRLDKILSNNEIKTIIASIGIGINEEELNPEKLRYGKIVIMTDADVDGSHISTLLLTLFYRLMRLLIETGRVYLAQPPLYRVKQRKQTRYFYSDEELEAYLKNINDEKYQITRYKGLGEMDAEQLWETTMNPETRILKRISMEDAVEADKLFSVLLGSDVESRRVFIKENAKFVRNLDV